MAVSPSRRLRLSIALLIGVQLLTSLGAVVLFSRMSPAIERILFENVASVEAVENMALALLELPHDASAGQRYSEALVRATSNITIEGERPAIVTLERTEKQVLAGETSATRQAIAALKHLGEVNRRAMQTADSDAQQLGTAGAWAAVFLAFAGLLISGATLRRLETRLLHPPTELTRVAEAHRAGDSHRRCTSVTATGDLALVMTTLNELFDHRERSRHQGAPSTREDERAIVLFLLDRREEPTAIVGERGEVIAANHLALEVLARRSSAELRDDLSRVTRGEASARVRAATRIGDTKNWLISLAAPEQEPTRP